MQAKRVKKESYDELVKRVGKPFADSIVSHLESQGKDIKGAGVAFKMPMNGEDEEGEDMEDDKGDKSDSEKSVDFTEKDYIVLAGMKQLGDFILGMQKTQDEQRKVIQDLANQVEQLKFGQGDVLDASRRQSLYFGQLTGQQPASKSNQTQYGGGNPAIDEAVNKNHEQQDQPKSVFEQMKNSGGVVIPTITPAANGNNSSE